MVTNSQLIEQAQGIARSLSYNDQTAAAKHVIQELAHRLGNTTVRIHKKKDGYLMVTLFGNSRFLGLRESFMWKWFSVSPRGTVVERSITPTPSLKEAHD